MGPGGGEETLSESQDCMSSPPRRDGTQRARRLGADAAALVHPAVVLHARRYRRPYALGEGERKLSASDRAERRWRRRFGGPLGAAMPTRVFLARHRCLAGATQA